MGVPLSMEPTAEGAKGAQSGVAATSAAGAFMTDIMPIMDNAYKSENPIAHLMDWLKAHNQDGFDWTLVRALMSHVRWNKRAAGDKNHPLHFIVQDIQSLREQNLEGKSSSEQQTLAMLRFAHFATCMPHLWCNDIVDSNVYIWSKSKVCAYASPNVPVPFVWLQADDDTEVRLLDCFAPPGFRMERLYVAVYRRVVLGIMPQIRVAWQITHAKEGLERKKTSYMIHLVVDHSDAKRRFNVLRPVEDVTFMILLTEGKNRRFVSCQLNDGKTNRLIAFPVCIHRRASDECRSK